MSTSNRPLHTLEEIRAAGRTLGAARVLTEDENELIATILAPVRDVVLANMRRGSSAPAVFVEAREAA